MDNIFLLLHCETNSFWCCFALGCKMTTWMFPHVCFLHTRFLHHSLSLWLPLLFKVTCRLFWSCSTAVILSPLIKITRKGTSSWLYCYLVCFLMVCFILVMEWCLQAILWILHVAWILGSTQTSLRHPLSAIFTNGKLHLFSHTKNVLNHIIIEWKRVASF